MLDLFCLAIAAIDRNGPRKRRSDPRSEDAFYNSFAMDPFVRIRRFLSREKGRKSEAKCGGPGARSLSASEDAGEDETHPQAASTGQEERSPIAGCRHSPVATGLSWHRREHAA
jgi:hypothetical protein